MKWESFHMSGNAWVVRPELGTLGEDDFDYAIFRGPHSQANAEVYRDSMNSMESLKLGPDGSPPKNPHGPFKPAQQVAPGPEIWERHRILIQAPDGHTLVSDLSAEVAVLHSAEGKSVAFWGPNPQKRMEIYKGNVVPPTFPIEKLGIYRIHWTEEAGGGLSVAAVGQDEAGNFWFAPTNWLGGKGRVPSFCWTDVAKVELITTQDLEMKRYEAGVKHFALEKIAAVSDQIAFPDESIVLEMHGSEHELFKITKFECRMLAGPLLGLGGEFAAKGLEGQEHVGKECTFHGVRTDACVGKFQAILVSWNPCGFYTFESTRSFTRPEPVYGESPLRKAYEPWWKLQQAKELLEKSGRIAAMTDEQAGAVVREAAMTQSEYLAAERARFNANGCDECHASPKDQTAPWQIVQEASGERYVLCPECCDKRFKETGKVTRKEIRELWHYTTHPGKVACGADVPNMQSTDVVQNVTCGRCIKTEVFAFRRAGSHQRSTDGRSLNRRARRGQARPCEGRMSKVIGILFWVIFEFVEKTDDFLKAIEKEVRHQSPQS